MKVPVGAIKYIYKYQRQLWFAWVLIIIVGWVMLGWDFGLGAFLASIYGLTQTACGIIDGYNHGYQAAEQDQYRKAFE